MDGRPLTLSIQIGHHSGEQIRTLPLPECTCSTAAPTLNVVQTEGSIRLIAYRQATPIDYNQALAMRMTNATAQHADAQARNADDQAKAICTLASAHQALRQ